jgi:uncharacterized damage-inducible protein DinB
MAKPALSFLAKYHVEATRHVLDRIGPAADVAASGPLKCLFFDTMHATVNHIAGVDTLWRLRLSGESSAAFDRFYVNDPAVTGIRDGVLWFDRQPDWEKARAEALEASLATQAFVEGLTDQALLDIATYARTDGSSATIQRGPAIMHMLNHGTHHRGQLHAAMAELGIGGVVLDMPALLGSDNCRFP